MKNTLMIGERYRSALEKPLADFDIDVLWICDNPYIDPRLAGHADLSAIRLGKNIVVSRHIIDSEEYVNYLTCMGYKLQAARKTQDIRYPGDANLCACVIGERLIHNLKCTDPAILECFYGEKIQVNQGYAKCSCCVVDMNSVISADDGIEQAVRRNSDIEILKINSGGISLTGFSYGFIGGASIVLDSAVLLTGKLDNERDRRSMEAFIRSRGKHPVYLNHGNAFDIGSAIVL